MADKEFFGNRSIFIMLTLYWGISAKKLFTCTLFVYVCRREEEPKEEGVKWKTLEHKGPVFATAYEPLPDNVKFYYDGKVMVLSEPAEEVAGFYARMLDHDYTTRELFNSNFFKDWRNVGLICRNWGC